MVANFSHELRTPLTAILGSIALLAGVTGNSESARPHLERLERNGRHLLALVDDVLEMSRTESGQMVISPGTRRVGAVVDEALADCEMLAAASHVTITNAVSGGPADLPYWGDEGRVRQIVVNLLTNAIKFTAAGGLVTISGGTGDKITGASLHGPGPWVYIRVEDTGRGIPPDRLPVIFEPFQQSAAEDQRRGTGLGLSISRQLARMMNGDLLADSEPGRGSRFTLWLPIAPSEPVPR
jgi:signal transduction histidine kinase